MEAVAPAAPMEAAFPTSFESVPAAAVEPAAEPTPGTYLNL